MAGNQINREEGKARITRYQAENIAIKSLEQAGFSQEWISGTPEVKQSVDDFAQRNAEKPEQEVIEAAKELRKEWEDKEGGIFTRERPPAEEEDEGLPIEPQRIEGGNMEVDEIRPIPAEKNTLIKPVAEYENQPSGPTGVATYAIEEKKADQDKRKVFAAHTGLEIGTDKFNQKFRAASINCKLDLNIGRDDEPTVEMFARYLQKQTPEQPISQPETMVAEKTPESVEKTQSEELKHKFNQEIEPYLAEYGVSYAGFGKRYSELYKEAQQVTEPKEIYRVNKMAAYYAQDSVYYLKQVEKQFKRDHPELAEIFDKKLKGIESTYARSTARMEEAKQTMPVDEIESAKKNVIATTVSHFENETDEEVRKRDSDFLFQMQKEFGFTTPQEMFAFAGINENKGLIAEIEKNKQAGDGSDYYMDFTKEAKVEPEDEEAKRGVILSTYNFITNPSTPEDRTANIKFLKQLGDEYYGGNVYNMFEDTGIIPTDEILGALEPENKTEEAVSKLTGIAKEEGESMDFTEGGAEADMLAKNNSEEIDEDAAHLVAIIHKNQAAENQDKEEPESAPVVDEKKPVLSLAGMSDADVVNLIEHEKKIGVQPNILKGASTEQLNGWMEKMGELAKSMEISQGELINRYADAKRKENKPTGAPSVAEGIRTKLHTFELKSDLHPSTTVDTGELEAQVEEGTATPTEESTLNAPASGGGAIEIKTASAEKPKDLGVEEQPLGITAPIGGHTSTEKKSEGIASLAQLQQTAHSLGEYLNNWDKLAESRRKEIAETIKQFKSDYNQLPENENVSTGMGLNEYRGGEEIKSPYSPKRVMEMIEKMQM